MKQWAARRAKRILLKLVRNETGQMSVFIALIFQVLFVFFAMVINIGLIVHDKINLQNAVDFGAYYAAQKQSEILNEIAHINYQIRQDYKLLAWRYRVLGTLGRNIAGGSLPPPAASTTGSLGEAVWPDPSNPSVCVANVFWRQAIVGSAEPENHCWKNFGEAIPMIPTLPVIAPFVPGVAAAAVAIANLQQRQIGSCKMTGPFSWLLTMQMVRAYKLSIASRKAVMQRLRTNLVSEDFVDQETQPVKTGVLKTIQNNLTVSNLSSFDDGSFQVVNGLADPRCAGPNGNGEPTIKEINTALLLFFTSNVGNDCTIQQRIHADTDYAVTHAAELASIGITASDIQLFQELAAEPANPEDLNSPVGLKASSLGFEKNPWCMAYVGVKARTQPRKPFAPFGEPVSLEARSFAQPFGGRIGPWYRSNWARAAERSGGNRTDPLTSPRLVGSSIEGTPLDRMPNYSRFPGDAFGLKSMLAMGAQRNLLAGYSSTEHLDLNYYNDFNAIPQTGDPLAWDPTNQTEEAPNLRNIRRAEMIAVAPDVFDATYYSVDPQYALNYLKLSESGARFSGLPNLSGFAIRPIGDVGSRQTVAALKFNSVANQVEIANGSEGLDQTLRPSILWYIKDWRHLLTGWASNAAQDFSFPVGRFGQCAPGSEATPQMMIPGGCAAGGRVGYSVRILSREHLVSPTWAVGGAGEAAAGILNPPSTDF